MLEDCASAYHREVARFRRSLIRAALEAHGGNRTHAARTLGLQRTYLLRLIRDFGIDVPRAPVRRKNTNGE